jgi:hypothetical protein
MDVRPRNNFLEQLERRRSQEASSATSPSPETASPIEEMSGEQLDEALNQARRDLLDAQHAQVRALELERVRGQGTAAPATETLADVLREKQRGKRQTWR